MIPHSIRRRLPLSYAAIALLAAVALGAVLLLTLRSYYLRVEREYLRSNAQAIGVSLAQLLEEDVPPEVLQTRLDTFSLLSDTQVQLFDSEGQWIAGANRADLPPLRFARVVPMLRPLPEGRGEWLGGLLSLLDMWRAEDGTAIPPSGSATPTPEPGDAERQATPEATRRARLIAIERGLSVRPARPGDGSDVYSSQVAAVPIYGRDDTLLGFVQLSQGPAYAREIVTAVAWGWGIASAVAVVLAAAVGWLISRRISSPLLALTEATSSMAAGDLAARADVSRKDEIGALARSYNLMADRVQGIIVTLQRFVSDAAHEIHTPLTALHTNLDLARRDPLSSDEHLEQAQAQVERLEALTAGLLDLSRLESGAQERSFTLVSLVPLAEELGEVYASRAEQSRLTFHLSLPEEAVMVRGDKEELRRMLANLLDNAVKFTPEGAGVCLGLRREGDMAVCWVEDGGIGIPEADLPHLFQRFHRGRNAAGYPGSGLGLAIVKAIVERHGGQIRVESPGQGARFTVRIPVA